LVDALFSESEEAAENAEAQKKINRVTEHIALCIRPSNASPSAITLRGHWPLVFIFYGYLIAKQLAKSTAVLTEPEEGYNRP
jgi:hypothetical protein